MSQEWKVRRDIDALRILIEIAEDEGLPASKILAKCGVSDALLHEPGSEIEAWQELTAIEQVAKHPKWADIALKAGLRLHATTLGTVGFAMMASKNLNEALMVAYKFENVSFWFSRVGFEAGPQHSTFVIYTHLLPDNCQDFCAVRGLVSLQVWLNEMLGQQHEAMAVELKCSEPEQLPSLRDHFPCGISFNATRNTISFPTELFDKPLQFADKWAQQRSVQELAKLALRRQASLSARIRAVVANTPGKILSEREVAKALSQSPSTLRRRLKEEDTTFREVRDQALHGRAKDMLAESALSVEEIAARLGYSEAASFVRSFKRLQNQTPAAWRRDASR